MPVAEVPAAERDAFHTLRSDLQPAALRQIFFAEPVTNRIESINGAAPPTLGQIEVIGGRTMGAGIAAIRLLSGNVVQMIERGDEASAVKDSVNRHLEWQSAARKFLRGMDFSWIHVRAKGSAT